MAEAREPIARTLETAAITTAASLALMGALGYVLVRQEDRRLREAVRRSELASAASAAAAAGPGGPSTVPTGPTGSVQPQRIVGQAIPLVPGRRYLAAVDVNFPLSLAASTSKVKAQAEDMGFRDVTVSKGRPPTGVAVPVRADADYYIVGTYARDPASIGRSHAAGRVEVLDAWVIG